MSSDDAKAEWKEFKVDASANGCTGMFFRSEPKMSESVHGKDWPRNGTIVQGKLSIEHKGWVQLKNGYWLPLEQHGKVVTHEIK